MIVTPLTILLWKDVRSDFSLERLTEFYINDIVRLHGVPLSIVTDRDDQPEQTIQILKDILRCCVLEFYGSWEQYLPLIKDLIELGENKLHGVVLIKDTEQEVKLIRDCLKAVFDRQKSYIDLKRKDIEFKIDDKVFHVSIFRKYWPDPSSVIALSEIEARSDMTYEEEPIRILTREVKELRN
ncbi:DNA/RNA polymerases superfamily protein [Gossypium australe]|uniref:DNA/RNA polymerases superfamily protein n=1 Tax=Gossypium australe TaxID=47621 RepID=A0A5B6X1I6_9ROSI|nr:DNA/RNA polymerases superfamily protein [Gossypium australe]